MRHIGLDVGTGTLTASICGPDGKVENTTVKDAFFKMDLATCLGGAQAEFAENVLKQAGAHYIKVDGVLYVLGDDAFKFANMFHQECLRPMANGVLNPQQPIGAVMLRELIRGLIGDCYDKEDVIYFCVPANPVDADFNIIYHTDMVKGLLLDLGYENVNVMNEGLAVIYSTLKDANLSGIGISFGAGMVNVAYAFMGIPVFSFSMAKSGDWIDLNVANAVGETRAAVRAAKENGVSLVKPENNLDGAISVYYNALMENIIATFKNIYATKPKKELPNIMFPLTAVVAGGTSLVGGFIDKFSPMLADKGFPVPIAKVVHAAEPLQAIAIGLREAAMMVNKKK